MKKLAVCLTLASSLLITTPVFAATSYSVKSGDSLWKIAQGHNIGLTDLEEANSQLADYDLIRVGQQINIPNASIAQFRSSESSSAMNISTVDRDLLAHLVHAEAKGEPFSGKVAVATVVLNRLTDDQFPNTIEGVIYQPNAFTPVANGTINETPTFDDYQAVDQALKRTDTLNGALYFFNPSISSSRWINCLTVVRTIGNQDFAVKQ